MYIHFYEQNNMITCAVIADNYNLDIPTGKKNTTVAL